MKCLGIDFGTKRIGLAVSDAAGRIAFPLSTLETSRHVGPALERVRHCVLEERVERVIVGMPLAMDGSVGNSARRVARFADQLARIVEVPVVTWDERFTTSEAQRLLLAADVSRQRRREVVDQMAAALILQSYLDSLPEIGDGQHSQG